MLTRAGSSHTAVPSVASGCDADMTGCSTSRTVLSKVLLWERALEPHAHRWSLPGGRLGPDEDVETSIRRQLAEKVDVRQLAHVEQLAVFSAPGRVPGPRVVATAFLGLVPSGNDPALPDDTRW